MEERKNKSRDSLNLSFQESSFTEKRRKAPSFSRGDG